MAFNYNALQTLETIRQQLALCKQFLIANDKVDFQATMTTVGTEITAMNSAIASASNIDTLQGIS